MRSRYFLINSGRSAFTYTQRTANIFPPPPALAFLIFFVTTLCALGKTRLNDSSCFSLIFVFASEVSIKMRMLTRSMVLCSQLSLYSQRQRDLLPRGLAALLFLSSWFLSRQFFFFVACTIPFFYRAETKGKKIVKVGFCKLSYTGK